MVAIIAHDRHDVVGVEEIDALATDYERVRGTASRHCAAAGSFARLVKFDGRHAAQPGIEQADGSWAAATGLVYPRTSLLGLPVHELDGQFSLIAYDAHTDQVTVATDPFGLQALYLAERDGKSYLSTSALTLARHLRATPNQLALSFLARTGQQFGPITCWEGIERLDPAICLTFAPHGRSHRTYWRLEVDETVARMSFRQAVDHAIEVLTHLWRRYAGRSGLIADLTGGYDTRLLTLLLARAGAHFATNTVGEPHAPDVRMARRVARAAGWTWARFRIPEEWATLAPREMPVGLAWADGRLPGLRVAEVLWLHERKSQTHTTLLAGGGGTVFRGHAWRQEFFAAGRSTQVNYDRLIRMAYLGTAYASLMADPSARQETDYLRALLTARAQPYAGALNTIQLDALLAYKCTAWEGMFGSAAEAYLQFEMPFFFKDAYTVAFSTCYRYRNHHQFVRAIVERIDPRLAALPTSTGGPAQLMRPSNAYRFAPYYGKIARATLNKVSLRVREGGLFPRKVEDDPRTMAGRTAVFRRLRLTADGMESASLYNRAALEALLQRADAPEFASGAMLDRIITAELLWGQRTSI
jgi:hypothetical protein